MNSMPSKRSETGFFFVSMVVVVLLAIGFGGYEFSKVRQAEEALAVAMRAHEIDQARLRQLATTVTTAKNRVAELQMALQQQQETSVASHRGDSSSKVAQTSGIAQDAKALSDGQEFLASFAQSREMLINIGKAQTARNFAAFIRSGVISPAQIEEFETRTSEHWLRSLAVAPNSIHPTDVNLPDDELRSILGEQGFQQFKVYNRMQPLQRLVDDVSSLSVFAPLSPEQATQLLNLMADASSTFQGGGKASPQSVDWNQVLPQAQGILSEPQFSALKAEAQLPQVMALVKQYYKDHPLPPGR